MSTPLPWATVAKLAEKRIEDVRTQLEGAPTEAIPRLQGEIKGLRFVLGLPDNLTDPDKMIGDEE